MPRKSSTPGADEIEYWHAPGGLLVRADNLAFMQVLPDACCDLIYIDPPFKTDRRRTSARSAEGFDDRWPRDESAYLRFLGPRFEQMHRVLSERGSLYVHVDWRAVHYVKVLLDSVFGMGNFLNEIIWSYRSGGRSDRWFARKHDTLLFYAKNKGRHVFHVQRDGRYRTDGLRRDVEGRPFKSTRRGRLYFDARGPAMTDVWDVPILSTVSRERTGYPSQKPEALLRRIIGASSDPQDLVADFFCGSGTTLAAASAAGRRWLGCDVTTEALDLCASRLGCQGSPPAVYGSVVLPRRIATPGR